MCHKANRSSMTINQSMRKSHMLGPTKTRFIFAYFYLINSIILNYGIKFTLISKHLKIKENVKWCLSERKWQLILLKKIGFLVSLKTLRMKNWRIKIIWKTRIWKIIWKLEFGKLFFKIKGGKTEESQVATRVACQRWPCKLETRSSGPRMGWC